MFVGNLFWSNFSRRLEQKFPKACKNQIIVQQENTRLNINICDPEVASGGMEDGWTSRIAAQPPNLPGLNVLEFGIFRAIHSLQSQNLCLKQK